MLYAQAGGLEGGGGTPGTPGPGSPDGSWNLEEVSRAVTGRGGGGERPWCLPHLPPSRLMPVPPIGRTQQEAS